MRNITPLRGGFKRFSVIGIHELVNWRIRGLIFWCHETTFNFVGKIGEKIGENMWSIVPWVHGKNMCSIFWW